MYTCQNGTNTMSEKNWKETLVEHTRLAQSYNYDRILWESILESMRAYQVQMNAPRSDSFSINL